MKYLFRFVVLLLFVIIADAAFAVVPIGSNANLYDFGNGIKAPAAISATISGPASVCQNSIGQYVTFSGSGGTTPYIFKYSIDGTALSVETTGANSSIDIPINTSQAKSYSFKLDSVISGSERLAIADLIQVTVNALPVITGFSFLDNQCSDTPVQFTPYDTGTNALTYLWDFGDGTTTSDQNPIHKFSTLGCGEIKYNVSLTVTNDKGCTSTAINNPITIKQQPDINFIDTKSTFDPFSNCSKASAASPNYTITVGNDSKSKACISSYKIEWGDGTGSEENATFPINHTFTQLGAFEMVITALGANGCTNSKVYSVKNVTNPSGGFISPGTTTNLCAPTTGLKFEIAKWGANSPGTKYVIDFGDNSGIITISQEDLVASKYYTASDPASSENYPVPHSYTISNCPKSQYTAVLKVISACNSTSFTANNITVLTKPESDFTVAKVACVNSSIPFTNTTVNGYSQNCDQKSLFKWDFGDGTAVVVVPLGLPQTAMHTYTTAGTYTVTLTAENLCGETTKTQQITINTPPTATITGGATVCMNSTPSPTITFTGANGTAPYTFTYTLNGTTKTATTTTGNSVTISAPTNTPGTFTYSLESVLESATPCSQVQTGTAIIVINPLPTATINGTKTVCLGDTQPVITFTGAKGTAPYIFTYNIDGGNSQTITTTTGNSVNVSASSSLPGTIKYYLTNVQDATINACSQSLSSSATITINPSPTISNVLSQTKCNGYMSDTISFSGSVSGTVYKWTNDNPGIGLAPSGNGDINPFKLVNNGSTIQIANISVTPTYTNAGITCNGTAVFFTITVNPAPIITNKLLSSNVCQGGTALTLTVEYSYGTGTPDYQWYVSTSNEISSGVIIPLAIDSTYVPPTETIDTLYYFCEITLPTGGCSTLISSIASVGVSAIPTIKIQPLASQSLCVGGVIPTPLTVSYLGGVGATSYQWYSNSTNTTTGGTSIQGATNASFIPSVFNNEGIFYYYAEIKFAGSSCGSVLSDTARINVVANPDLLVQPELTQTLCQSASPVDLVVEASGGLGSFSFQWYKNSSKNYTGTLILNATSKTYTPVTLNTGTIYYYCVISLPDGAGCKAVSDFSEVIVKAAPTFSKQPASSNICIGQTPTILSVVYINGTGTPKYQWYSNVYDSIGGGIIIPNAVNATYTPPANTVGVVYYYYCIITLPSGGCSSITSNIAQVVVNDYPKISNFNIVIESGQNFTVSPNSSNGDIVPLGTTYTWATPTISPANSISGSSEQALAQTSVSQLLTNITNAIGIVKYTVIPSSGNCVGDNFNIEVTVNPPLSTKVSINNISCFGEVDGSLTTNIQGGTPPYTFLWSGPNAYTSDSASISGLKGGDYTLNVTFTGGLPFTQTYTIIEPSEITLTTDIEKNVSCFDAANGEIAITAKGGTEPYKYSWTKDEVAYANTDDITNLSPGDYVVKVTDTNNCDQKKLSFTINEPAALSINLSSQTDIKCFGEATGAISVLVQGGQQIEVSPGVFDYKYNWTSPNGYTSANKDLTDVIGGIYNLTVTDNSGCNQAFEVIVKQPEKILVTATTTPINCYGDNNASIKLNISGGIKPYQAVWDNFASGEYQDNLSAGDYTIIVTDSNNCAKTILVNIPEAPIFKITPVVKNISCFGANDGSITLNFEGGKKPISFSWTDNSTAGTSRNNIGPGSYTVNITDGSPCQISRTFIILEPQPLELSSKITNAFECNIVNSGSIDLLVNGGTAPYLYSWSNGSITEDLLNVTAGDYLITVTDSNLCVQTAQYKVTRPLAINIEIATKLDYNCSTKQLKEICTAAVSGGLPPYQLSWSNGTISGSNDEIMETTQSGIIVLNVTDARGCVASNTVELKIPKLGIDFQLSNCDQHIFTFKAVVVNESETNTFAWDFGDGTSSTMKVAEHVYSGPGSYKVILKVTSGTNCISIYNQTIDVEPLPVITFDREAIFCTGDSILIRASGADSYFWNDGTTGDSIMIKHVGDYSVVGTTRAGCTATKSFLATNYQLMNYSIQSDRIEVTTEPTPLHVWSENIPFSNYTWDFGDGLNGDGYDLYHTYYISKEGYFDLKLKVINPFGCTEVATKRIWIVNNSIPNTFTPNGDGINDIYMKDWHVQVYNRNGLLMYDGLDGWDGNYNGKPVIADTYFAIVYFSANLGTKFKADYITVIR